MKVLRDITLFIVLALAVVAGVALFKGEVRQGLGGIIEAGRHEEADLSGDAEIIDGDTLRIGQIKVRLQGIDAPDVAEEHGSHATRALKRIIGVQDVTCILTGEFSYDREVGRCFVGTGGNREDLAIAMLEEGWARTAPAFLRGKNWADDYFAAEANARDSGRGIWRL